jgi:glycosyltransferase involved in cell wall biosynthesis
MKGNILFAATVYTHLANFHKPYIKLLIEEGYKIFVIANPSEGRKEEIEELGVTCLDIYFSRSPFSIRNYKALLKLNTLFKATEFKLIHVHTPVASFLVRYSAKKNNQKNIIYTAHGFHFFKGSPILNWLIYYNIEKLARRWTDGLIVINKEDYINGLKLGYKESKNIFITNGVGVSVDHFKKSSNSGIRDELKIPNQDIVITSVAELNSNKNHRFLLKNWKSLYEKNPNIHFLLVGTGELEEELKNYVNENQLKNIYFLGFRIDIPDILNDTDIFTLLSKREGLPKCIMEAMANSKPSIVTNVRGSRDLIFNGKSGFIIELDDNNALIESFLKLTNNPQLRLKMGLQAAENVKIYDLNNVKNEYKNIYDKFLT